MINPILLEAGHKTMTSKSTERLAWVGIYPPNVAIHSLMVTRLWDCSLAEADAQLREFEILGLLTIVEKNEYVCYRMADGIHQFSLKLLTCEQVGAWKGLNINETDAHWHLLERYHDGGLWHEVANDDGGYMIEHLVWHMRRSKNPQVIFDLFEETDQNGCHGWRQRRENLEQMVGFLEDLQVAWELADQEFKQNPSGLWLEKQIRLALIQTTLNSQARSILPELFEALVKEKIWTAQQTWNFVSRSRDSSHTGETLGLLVDHWPDSALREVFLIASEIDNIYTKSKILSKLAPRLPVEWVDEAFAELLCGENREAWGWAVCKLSRHVSVASRTQLLGKTLEMVASVDCEDLRSQTLSNLVSSLPDDLVDTALQVVSGINCKHNRVLVLCRLAPRLPEPERTLGYNEIFEFFSEVYENAGDYKILSELAPLLPLDLLSQTFRLVYDAKETPYRIDLLIKLAPRLPAKETGEILETLLQIKNGRHLGHALIQLAPHLLPDSLVEAIRIAHRIEDETHRLFVLSKFVPHLSEPERTQMAVEVFHLIFHTHNFGDRPEILIGLAAYLPKNLLNKITDEIYRNHNYKYRLSILSNLAPDLPEPQRTEVLQEGLTRAYNAKQPAIRPRALLKSAQNFSGSKKKQIISNALQMAYIIDDDHAFAQSLIEFVSASPSDFIEQTFRVVCSVSNEQRRAETLMAVASYLTANLFGEALRLTSDIRDENIRSNVMCHLSPLLPEFLLADAVQVVTEIQEDHACAQALASLGPRLPSSLLEDALRVAGLIKQERLRIFALSGLLPNLAEPKRTKALDDALSTALNIESPGDQAKALMDLASLLPVVKQQQAYSRALSSALNIPSHSARADVLVKLVLRFPEPEQTKAFTEALQAVILMDNDHLRSYHLNQLAPWLPTNLLMEAVQVSLRIEGKHEQIMALAPLIQRLSEPERTQILNQALATVPTIERKFNLPPALINLIPCLPNDKQSASLQEVFRIIASLTEKGYDAWIMAYMSNYLSPDELHETFRNVTQFEWDPYRIESLKTLAPHLAQLPGNAIADDWIKSIRKLASRPRYPFLLDLASLRPLIESLGGKDASASVFRAIQDTHKWWP